MAVKRKAFNMERFFQALGDNTRLRLLNLMGDQEICVCYFVEILEQPQPKISRHLAYLRSAGIVAARREGKWMHYRIVMPPNNGAAKVLRETLAWLREERAMQADRAGCQRPAVVQRSLWRCRVRLCPRQSIRSLPLCRGGRNGSRVAYSGVGYESEPKTQDVEGYRGRGRLVDSAAGSSSSPSPPHWSDRLPSAGHSVSLRDNRYSVFAVAAVTSERRASSAIT